MELSQHCQLCRNGQLNLKTGFQCSITSEKPDFEKKCSSFIIGKRTVSYIENYLTEFYEAKKTLKFGQTALALNIFISSAILGLTYLFWNQVNEPSLLMLEIGWSYSLYFVLIGISAAITVLGIGMGKYKYARTEQKILTKSEQQIKELQKLYQFEYSAELKREKLPNNGEKVIPTVTLTKRNYS